MHFDSPEYLLLLATCFAAYHLLPGALRLWLLIGASLLFYCSWNAPFVLLIALSAVVDFTAGARIHAAGGLSAKRHWLILSLGTNLGILGFFKYTNFFLDSLAGAFPGAELPRGLAIVLPIGISFYTFQTMSYSIDIYRGKLSPARSFGSFFLYVCFFPQLIAGPIERATHLMPQLSDLARYRLRSEDFFAGLHLIAFGLFKKMALSDNLALLVDPAYSAPEAATGAALLVATYAFAFQIFFDFSAYSDIARGSAQLLGIKLIRNFNLPYLAQDPSDFWRRWHISLSTWIRDYLYIALGGSRRGRLRTLLNLGATMALAGLWHGAAWTFVVWGLFHGALLVLYRVLEKPCGQLVGFLPKGVLAPVRMLLFFHLVCVGWVFFRAESLADATAILEGIGAFLGSGLADLPANGVVGPMALFALFFVVMLLDEHAKLLKRITEEQAGYAGLLAASVAAICLLAPSASTPFIYFQF